jgi:hypothetical protein
VGNVEGTYIPRPVEPSKKPDKRPPFTIIETVLLNAFVTITNSKGDKKNPLEYRSSIWKNALKYYNVLSNYTISPRNRISSACTTKNPN